MDYKLTFEDGGSAYLEHFGVKGMKWGVWNAETRKRRLGSNSKPERHVVKSRNGDLVVMERDRGGAIAKGLRKVSKHARAEQDKTYNYNLKVDGKNVGDFQMYQKPNREMNIVWGGIDEKHRNRGYMTAVIAEGEKIAKALGNEKITGELVGNSPGNSIHKLAKKRNYVKVGEIKTQEVMETWGGLTLVEKKL